jgi:hypothetical protein
LPPDSVAKLREPLTDAWSKYLRRHRVDCLDDFYPDAVAQLVARADRHSAKEDQVRKTRRLAPPRTGDAPVPYYSPRPQTRSDKTLPFNEEECE